MVKKTNFILKSVTNKHDIILNYMLSQTKITLFK